ncbi:MAG: oligosaccharide flippase family protein [bacterium]|nr:oligosaccharide flippase family protein [bacterium]
MFARLKDTLHDTLRWSETYTKTDMLYMTHGGFWLSLAKGVGLFSSLLFAVAMANLIPPEVFGTYKFVLSGAAIIGAFSLTGMGAAITQAVARGFEGALQEGTRAYFKWSWGVIGISIAVAIYYFINDNFVLAISFLIAGACSPIITGFSFFAQFISGKKDFRTQALYDSVRNVTPAAVLILTIFLTRDPILIILAYFVSSALCNFLLHLSTVQRYRPNERVDPDTVVYGKHASVTGILAKVAEQVDKVLVFHYLGAAQLAVYAFAQTPINNLKLLNDIPSRLALPKLSARGLPELQESLPRKVFLLVGIMLVIAIIYIVAAPFVFRLLFPQYLDAIVFTQILAISLIFAPGSMFNEALTAHLKKREMYISQTVLPVTRIALLIVLLPLYGIWGAVGALIVSQALMFALAGFLFWQAKHEA